MSSPLSYPQTPSASRNPLQYKPLNSSPLVDSPGSLKSSPMAAAQARRKSQYKSHAPTTPTARGHSAARFSTRRTVSASYHLTSCLGSTVEVDPQKTFLRDRLKARCFEKAAKAREKAIRGRRYGSLHELSSDDYHMDDDDDEEDDEDIMQDELFRRIMANATRRDTHSYRVSYAQEVGSSFDPDLEDISSWEQELAASNSADSRTTSMAIASTSESSNVSMRSWSEQTQDNEEELTYIDLDDEELNEYAEEYSRQAALADFEDLPEEELFSWSDGEELETPILSSSTYRQPDGDDIMDMS